jgi:prepilin-type processing-associated H-X9-DG protein
MFPPSKIWGNETQGQGWIHGNSLSWRVMILPQVDQSPLYNGLNLSEWLNARTMNPSPIQAMRQVTVPLYICPSDNLPAMNLDGSKNVGSNYGGMNSGGGNGSGRGVTTGCPYPAVQQSAGNECPNHADNTGGMSYRGRKMQEFVDGTSNTVCVGEVYRGKAFRVDENGNQIITGQRCYKWIEESGWCGVDGSRGPNSTLIDEVDWNDENHGVPEGSWGGRPMSSLHTGGAHALFADGAVRFISNNVDGLLWRATCTCAGLEAKVIDF